MYELHEDDQNRAVNEFGWQLVEKDELIIFRSHLLKNMHKNLLKWNLVFSVFTVNNLLSIFPWIILSLLTQQLYSQNELEIVKAIKCTYV